MTAITKAWVTIADGAVDADSPIDQALMTGLRDNAIHLREWLGASYTGGAVQNHNHDGVNSALIAIGPNMLRNGGFESNSLDGWESLPNTGGTITTANSGQSEGNYCATITSTVLANGGGSLRSAAMPIDGRAPYRLAVHVRASVSNVSSSMTVTWLNAALGTISSSTVYSATNTTTAGGFFERVLMPPSTARFAQVLLNGGLAGVGSSVGTITFDSAFMGEGWDKFVAAGDVLLQANDASGNNGTGSYVKTHEILSAYAGTVRVEFTLSSNTADQVAGRIYVNGVAIGTERFDSGAGTPTTFTEDITINSGDLIQIYARQATGTPIATVTNFRLRGSLPTAFANLLP